MYVYARVRVGSHRGKKTYLGSLAQPQSYKSHTLVYLQGAIEQSYHVVVFAHHAADDVVLVVEFSYELGREAALPWNSVSM
jgi:hypothetical protein